MGIQEALMRFPDGLRQSMRRAYDERGAIAYALMQRPEMSDEVALMAGLALDPVGRVMFEEAIQEYAFPQQTLPVTADEVIVGGGAHAAVYAAVRVQKGFPKPLVLERESRFGGTLAMTERPSFFLNSRNRPGPLGAPGTRDALNVIPGAPMQPADIGGFEYQTNADVGLVIRCALALNATIRQATVTAIESQGNRQLVQTNRGAVAARRVIVATGLGNERTVLPGKKSEGFLPDGKRVFTYQQFMRRLDRTMFPLRGLGRVAVIGGGDGGKTVIEALTGSGPTTMGSVAALDYIERIDWYGVGASVDCDAWMRSARTRYKRIGGLLPGDGRQNPRVFPKKKVEVYAQLMDTINLDGGIYDTAIVAIGYERQPIDGEQEQNEDWLRTVNRTFRLARANAERTFLVVGPAAGIDYAGGDNDVVTQIPENAVALFRLAPRTAAAAALLPDV